MVPSLSAATEFKAVLNWGTLPYDLDLMALQYSGAVNCTIYYGNKNCTGVSLDLDNTRGGQYGAETITWYTQSAPFKYIIYVKDFRGSAAGLFVASQVTIHSQAMLLSMGE